MKPDSAWVRLLLGISVMALASTLRARKAFQSSCWARWRMESTIPAEASTARIERSMKRFLSWWVTFPVPQPASMTAAAGALKGEMLWTQSTSFESMGWVTGSTRLYCEDEGFHASGRVGEARCCSSVMRLVAAGVGVGSLARRSEIMDIEVES